MSCCQVVVCRTTVCDNDNSSAECATAAQLHQHRLAADNWDQRQARAITRTRHCNSSSFQALLYETRRLLDMPNWNWKTRNWSPLGPRWAADGCTLHHDHCINCVKELTVPCQMLVEACHIVPNVYGHAASWEGNRCTCPQSCRSWVRAGISSGPVRLSLSSAAAA